MRRAPAAGIRRSRFSEESKDCGWRRRRRARILCLPGDLASGEECCVPGSSRCRCLGASDLLEVGVQVSAKMRQNSSKSFHVFQVLIQTQILEYCFYFFLPHYQLDGEGNGNRLQYSCQKTHGQRSLVGYSPRGHKESDMPELAHALISLNFCDLSSITRQSPVSLGSLYVPFPSRTHTI